MKNPNMRLALRRAKLIRTMQLLQQAHKTGRMSAGRHDRLQRKYTAKLQKLEERCGEGQDVEYGMVYSHLDLPEKFEAKKPAEAPGRAAGEGKPYEIFGGIFIKIAIAVLVFFLLGYFIRFAQVQPLFCVVLAVACPLLYLFIAYLFDRREPEPKLFVLGAFIWGMLAAVLALWLNSSLLGLFSLVVLGCLAGVTEELTKGIGLFRLSRHPEYNDPVDGILYGAAVGLGFAAFENLVYFAHFSNMLQIEMFSEMQFNSSLILRSTMSALGHACFTGVLSLMLARAKLRHGLPSVFDFIVAYLVAALLHGIFNGVIHFAAQLAPAVIGFLILGCLIYFWFTVKNAWKTQRGWQHCALKA